MELTPDQRAQTITDEIFDLYEKYGHEEYGESVTQLAHMVQSARLAEAEGYDQEVILAAFFHDIGHLCHHDNSAAETMGAYGTMRHEIIGSNYLREKGFSERLALLVENHVQAKRYLTYRDPDYYERLSEASKNTLRYQGGPMSAEEARAFEQDHLFQLSLRMRHWDEEAKVPDMPAPDLTPYKNMCFTYLATS